jgi:hypothetical protein
MGMGYYCIYQQKKRYGVLSANLGISGKYSLTRAVLIGETVTNRFKLRAIKLASLFG